MKTIVDKPEEYNSIAFLLAGRGGNCQDMIDSYRPHLPKTILVGVEPVVEWYPRPNGPSDQKEAKHGAEKSTSILFGSVIHPICHAMDPDDKLIGERVALVGFSAGAVIALTAATVFRRSFAAVVSHNGCVLDPTRTIFNSQENKTEILMFHNEDDNVFGWQERYIPTKERLERNLYKLHTVEGSYGGHGMRTQDVEKASAFLLERFSL